MAVTIKSSREIELMREAGRILAKTHEELEKSLKPGMSTWDIDRIGEEIIRSYGCIPSFKNYNGYPASICVSVNDEVVHGIPSDRIIEEGQIVSVDVGAYLNGFHGDGARSFYVGDIDPEKKRLIEVTKQCFFEGIKELIRIITTYSTMTKLYLSNKVILIQYHLNDALSYYMNVE